MATTSVCEATTSVCDPCSSRDKTSLASQHCTDCDENLCSECADVHRSFKAFKTHHVVPLSLSADHSFSHNKFCTKHTELSLELFCPDHDVLCCRACMTENHRSCEKLAPIEIASKGVKSSSMFEITSKRVEHLNKTGHEFTEEMKKIESDLKESKVAALDQASKLKEELLRRVDEIYSKSVSEINETHSSLQQKVEKYEQVVGERVQTIEEISKKFKFVSDHGSESQIFLLLNLLKFKISNKEIDFEETASSLKPLAVNFVASDLLSSMSSLGSVAVQQQSSRVQFKSTENQTAQIICPTQFVPTTFQLDKTVTYSYDNYIRISGMCVTRDGYLILCNNSSSSKDLLVLTSEGIYVQNIKLELSPWNIAIEPETCDAWVTIPGDLYVQIVDTQSMSLQRRINVVKGAYGIAFIGDNFAVSASGTVEIFSKQGSHFKTLQCNVICIHSLCCKENIIYCCAANANTFFGLRIDGTCIFTYESYDLMGPVCVKSDYVGNLYVLCCHSKNLHKLTAKGESVEVMLDDKTITNTAYAAAFNGDYSKMFIGSLDKKTVSIFSCK